MSRHTTAGLTVPVGDRDHVTGPATAPVTLVEYGDFECPHCGAAHPVVKELQRQFGDGMRFAFRHFPFAHVHPHAQHAAEAAEAAGAQGRFCEMHDILFENQDALDDESLASYAAGLGLDAEDHMSGTRSGVNGTPTFFVNGVRHDAPPDFAALAGAITDATEFGTALQ